MSFFRHSHTKKECTLKVCTPLSSWSVSIPGELLSSRAHLRFDTDNANISTIFYIFNLSNLREAYTRNRFNGDARFPFFENLYDLVWRKLALFHRQSKLILVLNCPIFGEAYNTKDLTIIFFRNNLLNDFYVCSLLCFIF